jgi:hypothetical protein
MTVQFCPNQQQPPFVYLQRFNMSTDLEWLLLRVCDIYNTPIELTPL